MRSVTVAGVEGEEEGVAEGAPVGVGAAGEEGETDEEGEL